MAITPRTLFTSPASATVATVSLLAFSAVGTLAYKVAQHGNLAGQQARQAYDAGSCFSIKEVLGHDRSDWSEHDWTVYASCWGHKNKSRMAVNIASRGLRAYPASEDLYNIRGSHQILLGDYAPAVRTLDAGLANIDAPTSGMMENNLAWAALWAPRQMNPRRGRTLYRHALQWSPNSCEMLHTGLWVEYALARQSDGVAKYRALKNFLKLRDRYQPCQKRIADGQWDTLAEVVGAEVLFDDVNAHLRVPHAVTADAGRRDEVDAKNLLAVVQKLRENYTGSSISALCREAAPLDSAQHRCTEAVGKAVRTLQRQRPDEQAAHHIIAERHISERHDMMDSDEGVDHGSFRRPANGGPCVHVP